MDTYPETTRTSKLPLDIKKQTAETDKYPPVLHSKEFDSPIMLPGPVNTSGAEDSPFITPDGKTLYFFFTPDVRIPVEKQLLDEVTGVWRSNKQNGIWQEPERIWLSPPGKLSLDGAVAVDKDIMWFASAREGYTGVNMFIAQLIDNRWQNWQYVGDRLMKEIQIGEVHPIGDTLYFHSPRNGGFGKNDIWLTIKNENNWTDPVNIKIVNSIESDGFPFVSTDGNALWFSRTYRGTPAIYRSKKINGKWTAPELIISQFAGEPTLDSIGNLYFVHHYFDEKGNMIEADIYVAYKK